MLGFQHTSIQHADRSESFGRERGTSAGTARCRRLMLNWIIGIAVIIGYYAVNLALEQRRRNRRRH